MVNYLLCCWLWFSPYPGGAAISVVGDRNWLVQEVRVMNPIMQLSDDGLIALERRECAPPNFTPALTAYLDGKGGTWTIGCGHTGPEVHQGMTITLDQARTYLRSDLANVESCLNSTITGTLEQNQYDALVSFVFNIGTPRWKTSTALKRVNQGKLDQVPDALRMYKYANGDYSKPNEAVVNRRNSEVGQWTRGSKVVSSSVDVSAAPPWYVRIHTQLKAAGVATLGAGSLIDTSKLQQAGTDLQSLAPHSHLFTYIGVGLIFAGIVWEMRKARQ